MAYLKNVKKFTRNGLYAWKSAIDAEFERRDKQRRAREKDMEWDE